MREANCTDHTLYGVHQINCPLKFLFDGMHVKEGATLRIAVPILKVGNVFMQSLLIVPLL